jgi:2,4-dienoyl-CoA reductase-like NADH-dependent reductase (Old Yellow Enzyme family)/NADPH-dependent 2,4-dienoyl-CoA reductase/sulfur reductase-like enzyme
MSGAPVLLSPASIGPVEIKNRVFVSSMCLYFSGKNGEVTDKMTAFFGNRARSGIGAFIIPANPHGANKWARGSLSDDSRIAQWKPLLDAIHAPGAKAFCQIHPSGIQFGRKGFDESPFALSTDEIKALVESYAQGALRAKKAGFDGVEIHGAHGHEVALLLSEHLNTRTDEYGGSLENCARSVAEMIARMKALCGKDFPVILRISGEERIPGGRELPGTLEICRIVQAAGCDAIHVSAGMPESEEWECPPSEIEQGVHAKMGKYLKERLDIPVIIVGRIVDWSVAERIVASGEADFVALARAALAEANWAQAIGREDVIIRRCIGCNQGCRTRREQNKSSASCLQNPMLGREETLKITKDAKRKKICVIGAGVSGLEAANVFSERGHEVTVFEREREIGGMFRWASTTPGKKSYMNVVDYYGRILPRRGVRINLSSDVTGAPEGEWDLVVAAVGGTAIRPPIKTEGVDIQMAIDFLASGKLKPGGYVVIGDGLVGYEIADYIIERNGRVILVGNDPRDPLATQGVARWHFMKGRFEKAGLEIIRHSTVQSIDANGFNVSGDDGTTRRIEGYDNYIMACGFKAPPEATLKSFDGRAPVLVVGNAGAPGDAMDAIHDAFDKTVAYSFD